MYEYSFERQIEFPLFPFIINHPPFSPQSKSYSQTLILYTASMASKNFYYLSACDLDKRVFFLHRSKNPRLLPFFFISIFHLPHALVACHPRFIFFPSVIKG
ncbi:hypothetical protein Hanom_Chr17g01576881 [Helianthus anomalus]